VPLKALVSQINYNLFDVELGSSRSSLRICRPRIWRTRSAGLMVEHDVALVERQRHQPERADDDAVLWRGGQIAAGGQTTTIGTTASIVDGLKSAGGADGGESGLPGAADGDLCQSGAAGSDRPGDEDGVQRGVEHGERSRAVCG
jgi:hypothetical protein